MAETNSFPRWPWGKLERNDFGQICRWQSLEEHSDDVASVFLALIELPGIQSRLARCAECVELDSGTIARLAYLVFLHDCGKVNSGFQARVNPASPMVGHIAPLAALFGIRSDRLLVPAAYTAINASVLDGWGVGFLPLFDAILSHHGRPWSNDGDGRLFAKHWRATADYDPIAQLRKLREVADRRFPEALNSTTPELPTAPAFVHAVAGLVQLADWIGSSGWTRDCDASTSSNWAYHTITEIGLNPTTWRKQLNARSTTFYDVFGRKPYPHQLLCGRGDDQLVILEAETGSGKTEAALWRFHELFVRGAVDGMYFALPTRTAAAQLHARVAGTVRTLWPDSAPPVVMAVPGYLDENERGALPSSEDTLDAVEGDSRVESLWAAAHPKRFFSAMIGVGTIDQALMACLRVKHAHLRASSLMRHLLVIDEVHASDPYMQRLLEQLLRDHLRAGGYALLLSATLGAESRQSLIEAAMGGRPRDAALIALDDAIRVPYPLVTANRAAYSVAPDSEAVSKCVQMETAIIIDEPKEIALLALRAAEAGAKVLVIRNTVRGALAAQEALSEIASLESDVLFTLHGLPTVHHSRFAREDRRLLDKAVEIRLGRQSEQQGVVIVGTQTLEQSLDIDADFLITDLCPIDVLLQRIGRLHRHRFDKSNELKQRPEGFATPRCMVLVPSDGLFDFLGSRRKGGAQRHGIGHTINNDGIRGVYSDVTILEATRRLVLQYPEWTIPQMNRFLVESGIHSQAIADMLEHIPPNQIEEWAKHRQRVLGDELAQISSASTAILRRDREYMTQGGDDGAYVTARLGADNRLLRFPDLTIGPFNVPITRINIPGWMVAGVSDDAEITISSLTATMPLTFRVEKYQFRYDSLGLHQLP